MSSITNPNPPTLKVVVAFAIVYVVWGSTYFFIALGIRDFPPMLLGALRFVSAGIILLLWCLARGERLFDRIAIRPAIISGVLILFLGNGVLIWSEQYLTTSLAAILIASSPIWFVTLDKRNWKTNFGSWATIVGLLTGLAGVTLLFGEKLTEGSSAVARGWQITVMVIVILGSIAWVAGSLFSKYYSKGNSNSVNAGWQMLAAGIAFIPASWLSGEMHHFHFRAVTSSSWLALLYLITMGSLAGYSAFIWLLQVRPAAQVSTYAYVNPVIAVLLGVLFAGEGKSLSALQLLGLATILVSVLLINLSKYRRRGVKAISEGG
jgi:drug/metabolite transporter (DMT)-like permease